MSCYIIINILTVALIMGVAWIWYLIKKNPGVIDMFWSIAIMASGLIALMSSSMSTNQLLTGALLLVWGIRLSAYLFLTRVLPGHVDERYLNLSSDWKISKAIGFLINYQFQGVLAMVIALPFWFIGQIHTYSILYFAGMILVMTGIIGESIADYQLNRYKKTHDAGVCDKGLWRYSRHPNYFFEWLVWVGFAVIALYQSYGYIAIASPLLLFGIMLYITAPMTEKQSLKSRGQAFKKYQRKTSMFFPWPPCQ